MIRSLPGGRKAAGSQLQIHFLHQPEAKSGHDFSGFRTEVLAAFENLQKCMK